MRWVFGFVFIFVVVLVGWILYVGTEHKDFSTKYKQECEAKNGVVIKDTGPGWGRYYCISKDAVIRIVVPED